MRVLVSARSPEVFTARLNAFLFAHSWTFDASTLVATHARNGKRIPDDTPELAIRRERDRYQLLSLA
jgi:hypothetical protein